MTVEHGATLEGVLSDILEKQAFVFAEACPVEDLKAEAEDYLHATIAFEGPLCGLLGLATSRDLCAELAANMLGIEPDDAVAEEDASDALKELLNVVCGQFLTALYGNEPVFQLSIPKVETFGQADWEKRKALPNGIGFAVDDEAPLIAYLSTGGDAP